VKALTWANIREANGTMTAVYTQVKTSKLEYLPLAKPAMELINSKIRGKDTDLVFTLQDNQKVNAKLSAFAGAAGIDKKVTFHVSRHTCATLLLSLGVGIETVSKILGHSDIKTTQIYAKVLGKSVEAGVRKLDTAFDGAKAGETIETVNDKSDNPL
jgi:site-specific recombinase XerD